MAEPAQAPAAPDGMPPGLPRILAVATAVLPPGYIRARGSDGSWTIRRRDPNDLRFQRLTVRPGPSGEPVIAVWRPFE